MLGLNSDTRTKGARSWASHMTCVHFFICEMGIPTSQGHVEVKWGNTCKVLRAMHGLWKVRNKCYYIINIIYILETERRRNLHTSSKQGLGRKTRAKGRGGRSLSNSLPRSQGSCDAGVRREKMLI